MLRKSKKVYLAISLDKYELPLAVFENIYEVCKFSNRTKDAIWSAISRNQIDRVNKCRYISIEIGGD